MDCQDSEIPDPPVSPEFAGANETAADPDPNLTPRSKNLNPFLIKKQTSQIPFEVA